MRWTALTPDADLLFVLTTNRADLLEPALAARPGRVDVAVEIDLPDGDARRRLLGLYARPVPMELTEADIDDVIERTDGVTASFLKELVRRAVLEAIRDHVAATHADTDGGTGADDWSVSHAQMSRALDDLLDVGQQVTRSLLGVGNDPSELPSGGSFGPRPGLAPHGGIHGFVTYTDG